MVVSFIFSQQWGVWQCKCQLCKPKIFHVVTASCQVHHKHGQWEMLALSKGQSKALLYCYVKLTALNMKKKTIIKCLKGTSVEVIVNSKHTCSYFHILCEWRAPSGLTDRPAVGGLKPTGGAGESCLWRKVTESTHWETYPKHSYWECFCESQLTLHGRKAHVIGIHFIKKTLQ